MACENPKRSVQFPVDYVHVYMALIARNLLRMTAKFQIVHSEGLPPGGYVLACNHRSFLDPVIVGASLRRRIHYFARSSLWKIAPIRWALDLFGGIPVNRARPQASTMTRTIETLRAGRPLLMFPEGTRTKTGRMGRFRDGPALVARRAKVPVIPAYLLNTDQNWPRGALLPKLGRGNVAIHFGPPLYGNPQLKGREQDNDLSQRVEDWLRQAEQSLMSSQAKAPPADG